MVLIACTVAINPLAQGQKLGPACINEVVTKRIDLIRNDDPVPITINKIITKSQAISILSKISDTILAPGATLTVDVKFTPKKLGEDLLEVLVFHSGLSQYEIPIVLKGYGDGTDVTVPSIIACIPELQKRIITLQNGSMNEVRLDSIVITGNAFSMTTPLPIIFPPRSQRDIEISFTGTLPDSGEIMSCSFYPCATAKTIRIVPYSATATLTLPKVKADPRGRVSMPITVALNERVPYSGSQETIIEFTSNQGLFLPDSVTSAFGKVSILSRDIQNETRTTRIRFEGDIPNFGTLCIVSGYVGIGDIHETILDYSEKVPFISSTVQTTYVNGLLQLTNICDNLFLSESKYVQIMNVYPQPAEDLMYLAFKSTETSDIAIVLADQLGREYHLKKHLLSFGENVVELPIPPSLISGTYMLKLMSPSSVVLDAFAINIIR